MSRGLTPITAWLGENTIIGLGRASGLSVRKACCTIPARLGGGMDHYRINKVDLPDGRVLKKKDILARDDRDAVRAAASDPDCPVCDVWRAGNKVGRID